MADTTTTNLNLTKPEVGASADTWGNKLNTDLDLLDGVFAANGTGTSVGINVGAGKVAAVAGTLNVTGTISGGIVAPLASPTFTGVVGLPSTTSIGPVSSTELGYLDGVTSNLQTQLDAKLAITAAASTYAPLADPTFTGTVTLPSTTSIGGVSAAEIVYLDGVTSNVQTQLNGKAGLASPAFTGTPTAPTASTGTNTTQVATTAFVQQTSFNNSLPLQTGNAGKYVTTDGTNASWGTITIPAQVYPSAGVAISTGTAWAASIAPGTSGNVLTSNGTTWASTALPSSAVQYPQNSQSANYTLVLGDAGKQIFHPASDALSRIYTIPSNASVAFPIGTVVLFTVENGGASISVAINSDTLVLGSGVTGTAPVSPNNTLMAIKVTATKWMANYLTQDVPIAPYVFAVVSGTAPYVDAYPFTSGVGFGTRYANPVTAISGPVSSIDFAPSGNAVAIATNTTPFLDVYRWSGNGFGARYADAATISATVIACATFSSQGNAIAVANSSATNIEAWRWDSQAGFGTKYSNPGTGTASATRAVAFHPSDTAIAVSSSSSPYINAYAWTSASGFGTKFANPATLPAGGPQLGSPKSIAFSPAGDAVAIAHNTSPFVTVYPWSGAGFGTKFANPATLPVSNGFSVAFSPAGDAIAVTNGGSPAVTVYAWSGAGFGSKYTNPGTLPTGSYASAFTPNGDTIAVADIGSPFIRAYPWSSATGFGTVYADPSTLPTAAANDIASTYNF